MNGTNEIPIQSRRAVSHAVDGNVEKCFDMNNEFKIFIDGVVIKSENTFVESCASPL